MVANNLDPLITEDFFDSLAVLPVALYRFEVHLLIYAQDPLHEYVDGGFVGQLHLYHIIDLLAAEAINTDEAARNLPVAYLLGTVSELVVDLAVLYVLAQLEEQLSVLL